MVISIGSFDIRIERQAPARQRELQERRREQLVRNLRREQFLAQRQRELESIYLSESTRMIR